MQSKRPIAKALRIFARSENLPVVIHCSQGRDRTGIITALLLRALGTDADAVALDYADSDINLQVHHLADIVCKS
jgi:protein-tyrosine phosphatase